MDILKRIQRFEEMIRECKDAKLLKKEVEEICSELDEMEVSIEKLMAQLTLTKIALDLTEKMEEEVKVEKVRVDVKHYLNGTIVEIDKKIPYSELFKVLCNVMDNFEEQIEDYEVIDFDMEKQQLHIKFVDEESLILDLSNWNLSEEVADVYVEGFVEYLEK